MEVYIDYIVVKSKRVNEHVEHLRKSFEKDDTSLIEA